MMTYGKGSSEYGGRHTGIVFNLMHPPLTNTPSARPIGLPEELLEDPEKVGRALAGKVFSTGRVVTSSWKTALGLRMMKLFPYFMGKFMSGLTFKDKN